MHRQLFCRERTSDLFNINTELYVGVFVKWRNIYWGCKCRGVFNTLPKYLTAKSLTGFEEMNKVELDKKFEELNLVSNYVDVVWIQQYNEKAHV